MYPMEIYRMSENKLPIRQGYRKLLYYVQTDTHTHIHIYHAASRVVSKSSARLKQNGILNGKPSIGKPLPVNVSVTLTFELITLRTF